MMIKIGCFVFILFTKPFSLLFWILYILCGISGGLDGFMARRMKQESELGAKLDSIADLIFISSVTLVLIPMIKIPYWAWIGIIVVIFIRLLSYLVGVKKFGTFTSLHTQANKLTGLLLFVSPVFEVLFNVKITASLLMFSALLSAFEEFIILLFFITSHKL